MSKSKSQAGSNPRVWDNRPRPTKSRNAPVSQHTRMHLYGNPKPVTGSATQPSPFRAPERVGTQSIPSAGVGTADGNRGPAVRKSSPNRTSVAKQGDLFSHAEASLVPPRLTAVESVSEKQMGVQTFAAAEIVPSSDALKTAAVLAELPVLLQAVFEEVKRAGGRLKREWLIFQAAAEHCSAMSRPQWRAGVSESFPRILDGDLTRGNDTHT